MRLIALAALLALLLACHCAAVPVPPGTVSGLRPLMSSADPSPSLVEVRASEESSAEEESKCNLCKTFISSVASQAVALKLTESETIIKAQSVCLKTDVGSKIGLECLIYHDVREWLRLGGLVGRRDIDLEGAANSGEEFCERVDLCGPLNVTRVLTPPHPTVDHNGAVVLFLKLKSSVAALPRGSTQWRLFVKDFLNAAARVLDVPVYRLELKMSQSDQLCQVIVKRSGDAEVDDDDRGVDSRAPTPERLALTLAAALAPNSNTQGVPDALIEPVDRTYQPRVAHIAVPQTVDLQEYSQAPHNKTKGVSCSVLRHHTANRCGPTFTCTSSCNSTFGEYLERCLYKQLPADRYAEVKREYVNFFDLCTKCTEVRASLVRSRCQLDNVTATAPPKCTHYCSKHYIPYYKECLTQRISIKFLAAEELTHEFYRTCSRCTSERVDAVQAVCDTRPGRPATPFPPTCTANCSQLYTTFFDECLAGEPTGLPAGSAQFRELCQVATFGGLSLRVKEKREIASIEDIEAYKQSFESALADLLDIPAKRVVVTTVRPAGNTDTSEYQSDVSSSSVYVDFIIKISDDMLKPDPLALAESLRLLVFSPASKLYKTPVLKLIDATYGVRRLVPGTHQESDEKQPTSLELAKTELRRAIETHASNEKIEMLRAVVKYHELTEGGAGSDEVAAALALVHWREAQFRGASAEDLRLAEARYDLAKAIAENQPREKIELSRALVQFAEAIAKGEPQPDIDAKRALVAWRRAIVNGASPEAIDTLKAVAQYLADVAAHARQQQIAVDQANVQYMRDIEDDASPDKLRYDADLVEYMNALLGGADTQTLVYREAVVEYDSALLKGLAEAIIQQRKAIVDYQAAIEAHAPEELLARLAQLVLDLTKEVQKQQQVQQAL